MPKKLSFTARRMLALSKGKENIDDFPELETFTILCVSRDLVIRCNKNNLGWWLKNANYDGESGFWE